MLAPIAFAMLQFQGLAVNEALSSAEEFKLYGVGFAENSLENDFTVNRHAVIAFSPSLGFKQPRRLPDAVLKSILTSRPEVVRCLGCGSSRLIHNSEGGYFKAYQQFPCWCHSCIFDRDLNHHPTLILGDDFGFRDDNIGFRLSSTDPRCVVRHTLSGPEGCKQQPGGYYSKGHHNPLRSRVLHSDEPARPIPPIWPAFVIVGAIVGGSFAVGLLFGVWVYGLPLRLRKKKNS